MSNHLTSEVYKRRLGSLARNAVMVLMADKASDDGCGIWASKQRMADELGCSKQTVIDVIKALIADGLLIECGHRPNANGYTVEYAIDVAALRALPLVPHHCDQSSSLTGQKSGPVNEVDATGQAAGPHQSSSLTQTPLNPPEPPRGGRARAHAATAPVSRNGKGEEADRLAARLPDDWEPPARHDLTGKAADLVAQWPAGAFEASCECFRLHWLADDSRASRKRDWAAALGKWLIGDHPKVMRDAKAGVSFARLANTAAAPGLAVAPRPARRLKAAKREGEASAALRERLAGALGDEAYRQWFEPAALVFDDPGLKVITGSEFARGWLEQHFAAVIKREGSQVVKRLLSWVRFEVEQGDK